MLASTNRQPSFFYVVLDREAALIKDEQLERIDALLDNEDLVQLVRDALGKRSAGSCKTGRKGIAADRVLRCAVLMKLKRWSLRELERELRPNLVYRKFTRFDEARIPDYSTFSRTFALLSPETIEKIHEHVVLEARTMGVAPGRKMRTDTTVVETNVHYPTDSTLLSDGARVLTRGLMKIAAFCEPGAIEVVDHARKVKHRVLEIVRAAKVKSDAGKERLVDGYRKLVGVTKSIVRNAETVSAKIEAGTIRLSTGAELVVKGLRAQLSHYIGLVRRVIVQTKERVFRGNTHWEAKLLSLFEPDTAAIRKGKAHKPTEFGRLVQIDEVENGIVSGFRVRDGNPSDADALIPAVLHHKTLFGRAPKTLATDRGFFSAKNEADAIELGVKIVAIPKPGKLSSKRARKQRERSFQRAQAWRAGGESRIATLKHRFGMNRAMSKGDAGHKRDVGLAVITNNLVSIARWTLRRAWREQDRTLRAASKN
jgi:IS5 family transposase